MSAIETTTDVPAVKPRRKARKVRKPVRSVPKAPKPAAEFAGMTVTDCCKGCGPDGCVISGQGYCAHPRKGGLQGSSMHDTDALRRSRAASKLLAREAADRRFG